MLLTFRLFHALRDSLGTFLDCCEGRMVGSACLDIRGGTPSQWTSMKECCVAPTGSLERRYPCLSAILLVWSLFQVREMLSVGLDSSVYPNPTRKSNVILSFAQKQDGWSFSAHRQLSARSGSGQSKMPSRSMPGSSSRAHSPHYVMQFVTKMSILTCPQGPVPGSLRQTNGSEIQRSSLILTKWSILLCGKCLHPTLQSQADASQVLCSSRLPMLDVASLGRDLRSQHQIRLARTYKRA